MAKTYILKEGGLHDKFMHSRAKIQFFGGGFGNGKTSAMCVKALGIAKDYPGANILMARSTYPKLNDTMRKTFLDFCPPEWVKSFPMSKNSDNTCTFVNDTKFNFRYIAQRSSTDDGGSTSNLLSATYDLAVIDQLEDPEIVYKDFIDILGRMRGNTTYRGSDPTMPRSGPRWIFLSSNPTRNWVYKKIVEPYHRYLKYGVVSEDLLCLRDPQTGNAVLGEDGKPILLIEIVEGSTYENAHVLDADFIQTLESAYTGQMKDRFLKGEWVAYEGLVYPDFSEGIHVVRHDRIVQYMNDEIRRGAKLTWREAYDYGLQVPSCYLLAFTDTRGNTFIVDGFYRAEFSVEDQAKEIENIRHKWGVARSNYIYADPSIFRRAAGDGKTVGKSIADLFFDHNSRLLFTRGNNDIINGITKVRSYLQPRPYHVNPIDSTPGAPFLYVSDNVPFVQDEFSSYYWKTNSKGDREDVPVDKNDHAMDTIKYLLSYAPEPAKIHETLTNKLPAYYTEWQEMGADNGTR